MNDTKKLKDLCKWVKEQKGITEIGVVELVEYVPEYEEWLSKMEKQEGLSDESIMPFGEYIGKPMIEVPDGYLKWIYGENKVDFSKGSCSEKMKLVMGYIEDSFEGL